MLQVHCLPPVRHQLPEVTVVESLNRCLLQDVWMARLAAYQWETTNVGKNNFAGTTVNR